MPPTFRTFASDEQGTLALVVATPHTCLPQVPSNHHWLSGCVDARPGDTSYKQNHALCSVLCLASVMENHTLKVNLG